MMKNIRCQLAFFGVLFLLAGCQDSLQSPPKSPTNTVQSVLDKQNSAEKIDAVSLSQSTQPMQSDISRRLETSYARVSASQRDICPKLVDFQFERQSVVRHGEQLNQYNYCEYFVFLNKDDRLSVITSNSVQADLVAPDWFNFNNGSYIAKKFDRYTIRLSYDGTRYRPENFVYDVHIHKNVDN